MVGAVALFFRNSRWVWRSADWKVSARYLPFLLPVFFPTVCFIESARKNSEVAETHGSYLHGKPGSSAHEARKLNGYKMLSA